MTFLLAITILVVLFLVSIVPLFGGFSPSDEIDFSNKYKGFWIAGARVLARIIMTISVAMALIWSLVIVLGAAK